MHSFPMELKTIHYSCVVEGPRCILELLANLYDYPIPPVTTSKIDSPGRCLLTWYPIFLLSYTLFVMDMFLRFDN
jgi:hypothetical protein